MAVLTPDELVILRREVEQSLREAGLASSFTKAQLNARIQAIEDWFEANRTSLAQAIDAAAPGNLTVAQKKRLVAHWLRHKFGREV